MDVISILRHSLQATDGVNPITKHFRFLRQAGSAGQEMVWKIYDAVRIQDGMEASVFLFEKRIADKLHKPKRREIVTEILRREVSHLTRLKHPALIRVYHGLEECTDSIAFATEPVLASLANLLGNYDRLPSNVIQDLKDHSFADVECKCGMLQIAEALFYLHVTEQTLHLNLSPQSIFVTRRGIWKLGGFGFAKPINDKDLKPWMSKSSKMAQPDLDYVSPEIQMETPSKPGCMSTACDVFSLGLLICSVYNGGRSLIQAANSATNYARQLDKMGESFAEIASKFPPPIVDQVLRMVNRDAPSRPTVQSFIMMKYFDDAIVHCMQSMNSIDFQDFNQKRETFTILAQTIPLFPRKLLYNTVFPMLREQMENPETLVLALPSLLHIVEISTNDDYKNIVQQHLKNTLANQKPVQATVYLLEKMDILLSKATEEDIKTDLLPLVFNTLASNNIQGQEAALNVFSTIRKYVDDDSLRKLVLPKAKSLFCKSTNVRTRQVALEGMDRLLESLDKMMILDEVLPFLTEIQCSDVDIIMSIVAIYKHLLSDKKFGLTHNLLATKVMPTLIPHTVCPGLSISQFNSLMDVLHNMMDNIEMERLKKMANEIPDQDNLDNNRRKSLDMRYRQMADCAANLSYGSFGEKGFLNVDEKYFTKYRPPSTPELMINSSQDSLGPKTYRRHSSFQSLGLAEQAVIETIIRQRRSSLISPHLRLSGSANPHIYVSQASISDFKPMTGTRRRSSTVSTGPILIPDVGRRDSYGRLITKGYGSTRRSSFQGICETAMQFFGAK